MATNPATQIAASKIDTTDPAYPYGKAQDILAPGDGKGTPRLAFLINDIFGFQQAMLKEASPEIVPSGTPDKVGASQYLEALINIIVQNGGGSVPDASETVKGILELADQTEADAGLDDLRAMTALKVANRPQGGQSLTGNGYQIFDGGLIIQWGSIASAANTVNNIALPLTYPTAHHQAYASISDDDIALPDPVQAIALSTTQIRVTNGFSSTLTIPWFSIGN